MSNPIADTAEYFARWKANSVQTDEPTWQPDQPSTSHSAENNNDDVRHQWLRVFNRISFLNPLDMNSSGVISDDESAIDRDTFELMRSGAKDSYYGNSNYDNNTNNNTNKSRSRHHSLNMLASTISTATSAVTATPATSRNERRFDKEEEKLPSAYDLKPIYPQIERERTYFKHPYPEQPVSESQSFMMDIMTPSASSTHSNTNYMMDEETENNTNSNENSRVKDKWDRTLDRLKWIAHLQSMTPTQSSSQKPGIINGPSHTLATYYPPAFDPVFAAFAKDEYGRRLPPILLQCVYVNVTDSECLQGSNQWVFRIELQYGDVKWVIRRSIADFMVLHYKLKVKSNLFEHVPDPPVFPNQLSNLLDTAKETIGLAAAAVVAASSSVNNTASSSTNQQQRHHQQQQQQQQQQQDSSERPDDNSSVKSRLGLNKRMALCNYLRALLLRAHMAVSYDICEFLELSAISIVQDMGWKGKEGYLRNRMNYVSPRCCQLWKTQRWSTAWIILRDSYMAFCNDNASPVPTDVLLFDKALKIEIKEPRVYLGSWRVTLSNESRKIEIKGPKREIDQWLESIYKVKSESPWVQNHRFGSFAPIRYNSKVKWFVDGENHFNAVAEAILSAKSEIYIADWWLTPQLYLRRPPEENEDFRLDRLLHRKAQEGVKIYIVVYKEMSLALTIDSAHSKQWLQGLHPNIIVQRHPDHNLSTDNTVLFWSHHEKIVVVDNRLAFIGGLDLCFGRYDTHSHSLSDAPALGHDHEIFRGQDYSNPRVKDFVNVSQFDKTLVDKSRTARMPWHDVTLGVVGPIARDIARHFIQRWNFLKSTKSTHRKVVPYLMPKGEYVAARDESNFSGSCKVQLLRSSARWSSDIEREHSIYNAYMECITHSKHYIYIENQFFISTTQDDKVLRNKIAQALVERIRRAHENREKFRVYVMIPLVPAFEGDLASSESSSARTVMHFQYITISRGGNSIMEKLRELGINPNQYISWFSLRNWGKIKVASESSSSQETLLKNPFEDNPIQSSSISLTTFPTTHSSTESTRRGSSNSTKFLDDRDKYVSELLYIHDKLMIVDDKIVIMGSANINDRSQLGNRDSEIAMIVEDTEMINSFMNGKEYKASKFAHTLRMQLWKEHLGLLDFDDWSQLLDDDEKRRYGEVEKLNIPQNNAYPLPPSPSPSPPLTSLSSSNEEEIKLIEKDEPVKMLDRASRTFSFYDNFKTQQHPRRHDAIALDPLSDKFYNNIWIKTAETNTRVYRKLFRCVPDDTVHTYEQHRKFMPDPTKVKYGHVADQDMSELEIEDQLDKVKGHIVMFPTDYLKDENLVGSNLMETVTPLIIFT